MRGFISARARHRPTDHGSAYSVGLRSARNFGMILAVAITLLPLALASDNGVGLLPPMGWRSWNLYSADISDAKIRAQINGLVKPRVGGESLLSLGYSSIGIDEGWEGWVVNGTQLPSGCHGPAAQGGHSHWPNGTPAVAPSFPSMPDLVAYGHAKKVQMGWYFNGCGCSEHDLLPLPELLKYYTGDVDTAVAWGFDMVKMDSCGVLTNMTLYGALFNASGKAMAIEQCNQGKSNKPDEGTAGQMGPHWCPFNTFRTSGDIKNMWERVMSNLMSVVPYLGSANHAPLSRPGCYAYADIMEVGRMPEHNLAESRSHFSAWAIVSSPLILGLDMSDDAKVAAVWSVVSNKEVIEISQSWVAGRSQPTGRLVKSWQAPNVPTVVAPSCDCRHGATNPNHECSAWDCSRCDNPAANCSNVLFPGMKNLTGWHHDPTSGAMSIKDGQLCLDTRGQLPNGDATQNVLHMLPCDGSSAQRFAHNANSGKIVNVNASNGKTSCLQVTQWWTWLGRPVVSLEDCNPVNASTGLAEPTQAWIFHQGNGSLVNGEFGCVGVSGNSGPASTIWTKPLTKNRTALLVINAADASQRLSLDLGALLGIPALREMGDPLADTFVVRDVWKEKELGSLATVDAVLPPHDCLMLVLSPTRSSSQHYIEV